MFNFFKKKKHTDEEVKEEIQMNSRQLELVEMGRAQGLDVTIYNKPEFIAEQMEIIVQGLIAQKDVKIYARPAFSPKQMSLILEGLQMDIDARKYASPYYTIDEMKLMKRDLTIEKYIGESFKVTHKFTEKQLDMIDSGLQAKVDVSALINAEYSNDQMVQIFNGLMEGIDVSPYANPNYSAQRMSIVREALKNSSSILEFIDDKLPIEQLEIISKAISEKLNARILAAKGLTIENVNQLYDMLKRGADLEMNEVAATLEDTKRIEINEILNGLKMRDIDLTELIDSRFSKDQILAIADAKELGVNYELLVNPMLTSGIIRILTKAELQGLKIEKIVNIKKLRDTYNIEDMIPDIVVYLKYIPLLYEKELNAHVSKALDIKKLPNSLLYKKMTSKEYKLLKDIAVEDGEKILIKSTNDSDLPAFCTKVNGNKYLLSKNFLPFKV